MTIDEAIQELTAKRTHRFKRVALIAETFFGAPRVNGSHHIFKVQWRGEPFVNIQPLKGGKAKPYQVGQLVEALKRLKQMRGE